ncbi:MAG: DUF1932 domain-containing protein [Ardenticatenaceae bacterium]
MNETIGILHPGSMGVGLAKTMQNSGYEVLWVSEGRSSETRERAEGVGLTEVGTLAELCARCSALVSVCPPHGAEELADQVLAQGFEGLYVDANAISPQKAQRIGQKMSAAGVTFVDGGIIGGPPTKRNTTWLYLSGPVAQQAAAFFSAGPLESEVLGEQIGKASALKMCFAANTKGTLALLSAILGTAETLGVRDALERQWSRYGSDLATNAGKRVQRVAHTKAWRFMGEMEEMVETFGNAGLPNGFFKAAAQTYGRLAHFKNAPTRPELQEVLAALQNEQ